MKTPVLVLFGPTASGKTALLMRLFGKGRASFASFPTGHGFLGAEVISADSMQVYRGMDIGTAKPDSSEQAKIPHHLISIKDPDEQFNAGEFVRLAEEACSSVFARGALPVVSGGTGFYLKNFCLGLSEAPPQDAAIRCALREDLAVRGAASLMLELAAADLVSAKRIHVNDEYRLLRALEVYRLTGRPLSSYASPWNNVQSSSPDRPFRFLLLGLRMNREELYRRINERTGAMFRAGLPDEVRRLFEAGYTPSDPGLRAIGYREFFVQQYDLCEADGASWRLSDDLAGVKALITQNSRRYAKRQITYFASLPDVKWIECSSGRSESDIDGEIRRELSQFLNDDPCGIQSLGTEK